MFTRSERIRLMVVWAAALAGGPATATDLDTIREQDPALGAATDGPPVAKFHPRLKALWLEALARPEADLKRQAADAIARAHVLGMAGLNEAVPRLVAELEAADANPVVRLTVAHALIALNARTAAPSLMRYARSGDPDAARLVEPALARWNHVPTRVVWLARLADPKAPRGELVLAIRAASVVKLTDAAPHLRRLALDARKPGDVRLEAARALAVIQPTGLEADARTLAGQQLLDRLVAASLLVHHRGTAAEELLLKFATDREPAVAAIAVGRLVELDPARLKSLYDGLAKSSDSSLRHLAARGLAELKTPEAVDQLTPLLADAHRDVRVFVREALIRLASTETLRDAVARGATRILAGTDARGLEQAAIVIGAIRHEPVADRLVALLPHAAGEVRIAVAWALRRLAVGATAGPILARVQAITDAGGAPAPNAPEGSILFRDLEHLIEALGVLRHRPADAVLRNYLPAPPMPIPPGAIKPAWLPHLRAAAVWSLGHIHAADVPPDLIGVLQEKLRSGDTYLVRAATAIALGRVKAKDAETALRESYAAEKDDVSVRRASGWAVGQITGKDVLLPPFPASARERWHTGWFLEPLEPAREK